MSESCLLNPLCMLHLTVPVMVVYASTDDVTRLVQVIVTSPSQTVHTSICIISKCKDIIIIY